ncbi:hypothetical protein EVAR_49363_1 [Eumeta japonica]|uniref:Uncharacterized protein n=1 Tax=Eumeta variegata TaxID=151549 RepID=A0A4C1XYS2_EUMVA|nr:hypothetical protein EVAR_49363_1 [Eumeta japonica]
MAAAGRGGARRGGGGSILFTVFLSQHYHEYKPVPIALDSFPYRIITSESQTGATALALELCFMTFRCRHQCRSCCRCGARTPCVLSGESSGSISR